MQRETTIKEIFSPQDLTFSIPPYQRAYSWDKDKQLRQFLEDLKEHPQTGEEAKDHFLGHFLFEREKKHEGNEFLVIDGQQRLTTVVIFFHCLGHELAARKELGESLKTRDGQNVDFEHLRQTYVIDHGRQGRRKLRTVGYDDDFFRSLIIQGSSPTPSTTHSGRRLKEAVEYFTKRMKEEESTSELIRWMELVEGAVVTTFEVQNKDQATQIFAFQNDRGMPLKKLEKLKAYLMHQVYVHSSRSMEREFIEDMERKFGDIYRLAEEIEWLNEDQVLGHHLTAFLAWTDEPVNLLKRELQEMTPGHERVEWIRDFCAKLVTSFQNVKKIETLTEGGTQHERLIGDILHLDAPASWPLLLKLMHFHPHQLASAEKVLRFMEITVFKLKFMKGKSTNRLPNIATYYTGNLEELERELQHVSQRGFHSYWDFNGEFRRFLEGSYHYDNRTRYLLWKYENHLRSIYRAHHLSLREFRNETPGHSLDSTIEHIMPKDPETLVHSEDYKERFLHNLGNLVLMTHGRNSSLKNKLPKEKADELKATPYLTQQAVANTIHDRGWGEMEIDERKQAIIQFALAYWQAE